jgi:hypothetical protein
MIDGVTARVTITTSRRFGGSWQARRVMVWRRKVRHVTAGMVRRVMVRWAWHGTLRQAWFVMFRSGKARWAKAGEVS